MIRSISLRGHYDAFDNLLGFWRCMVSKALNDENFYLTIYEQSFNQSANPGYIEQESRSGIRVMSYGKQSCLGPCIVACDSPRGTYNQLKALNEKGGCSRFGIDTTGEGPPDLDRHRFCCTLEFNDGSAKIWPSTFFAMGWPGRTSFTENIPSDVRNDLMNRC